MPTTQETISVLEKLLEEYKRKAEKEERDFNWKTHKKSERLKAYERARKKKQR